jgi:hypothetical protein
VNPSDWDDTPVREALSFPFVVFMNYSHVRADEPDFGHRFAHQSRSRISRIGVEAAEKRLDRVGPNPAPAECIDPHGAWGVDGTFSVSIVRAHGLSAPFDHVKHRDAIRGPTLTGKLADESQDQ